MSGTSSGRVRPGRMPLEGVVFDLFHTLVDPEKYRPEGFGRAQFTAEFFGLDETLVAEAWPSAARLRMVDESGTLEGFIGELMASAGRCAPLPVSLDGYLARVGRYQDLAITHPPGEVLGALELLAASGLKIGLLTNAEVLELRTLDASPLRPLLDVVVASCRIGAAKPEPAAYRAVLERMGIRASRCAYVGDGGSDELLGARRAGFGLVIMVHRFIPRSIGSRERERRAVGAHMALDSVPDASRAVLRHGGSPDVEPVAVRKGRPADLERVDWLWRDATGAARVTRDAFARGTGEGSWELWLLESRRGQVLGQLVAILSADEPWFADGDSRAYLCAFEVRPGWRGRGLGGRLVRHVLGDLAARGYAEAVIGVEVDDRVLRDMYRSLGFTRVARTLAVDPFSLDGDGRARAGSPYALLLARIGAPRGVPQAGEERDTR